MLCEGHTGPVQTNTFNTVQASLSIYKAFLFCVLTFQKGDVYPEYVIYCIH